MESRKRKALMGIGEMGAKSRAIAQPMEFPTRRKIQGLGEGLVGSARDRSG